MSWSKDYKKSIDCDNPRGFSQRAHCAARKKRQSGEKTVSKSPFSEQMKPYRSPEQIAKKHKLEVSFIEKQLKIGEPIEHEHTKDHNLAMKIALQHLDEIPDYYTRLIKMERSAKNQSRKKVVKEDLRNWFNPSHPEGGWKRYNTKGEAIGQCARKEGEPKPKCLSNEKAAKLRSQGGAKAIASAVRRKRSQDPVANRKGKGGKPKMVSNKIEEQSGMIRYCPKCQKNEMQSECKYGPSFWAMYSTPPMLTTNQMKFDIAQVHPANESKEMDHEYSMARSELSKIIDAAKRLKKKMGKGEGNIEAWVQSKITRAADYIDTAADYVDSGEMQKEACWDGYKQLGMKKKGKKMVPNCVKEENKPTNPKLWAKWKAKAKAKFDVYPSAYANGWAAKGYKSEGGGWKSVSEGVSFEVTHTSSDASRARRDKKIQGLVKGGATEGERAAAASKLAGPTPFLIRTADSYEPEGEQIDEFVGLLARLAAKGIMRAAKPIGKAVLKSVDKQVAKAASKSTTTRLKPGTGKVTYKPSSKPSTLKYGDGKQTPTAPKLTRSQAQKALDDDPWTRGAFSRDDVMRVRQDRRNLNNSYEYSNWRADFGLNEDWQKVNRQDKTDGLSQKAVNAYRRENPGSKLQTAVTEKKPTGKRAKRRSNFCSRMKGMKSKLTSAETARDPDSRINKALRRWNCN